MVRTVLDPNENVLTFSLETGSVTPEFSQVTRQATFREGEGLSGRAWKTRDLVFVPDLGVLEDCCRREPAQRAGVKSGICFPIILDGKVRGTMDFFALETLELSEERTLVLKNVARLVSSALSNLSEKQDIAVVSRVLEVMTNVDSQHAAVQTALNLVRDEFGWAYGSYWRLDPVHNRLVFSDDVGQVNPEFHQVTQTASFKEGEGLSGRAWKARDLVFVQDLGTVTDCCRRESAQRAGVKSGICFPIIVGNRVLGTMDFFALEVLELSASRMNALRNIGRLLSSAFERIETIENAKNSQKTASILYKNVQELAEFSAQLQQVSQRILKNSEDSAVSSVSISGAAEQVSANANNVAAAVEEMSATIRDVAQQATTASAISEAIERQSRQIMSFVSTLGESAKEIEQVVEIIKNIASQTNLLALNATIEAASAGEAGKGFAVVANEVKELAKQSASSTENIRRRIDDIQANTQQVIASTNEIADTINQMNTINTTIASAVEEQSATANEISRNVTHAAVGSNDISRNITHLASVSEQTVSNVREVEDAVIQLSQMAEDLQVLVDQLK